MHTPWGRYCWTRPLFGISSAPEEFQRRLHDVVCSIKGVVNIADDITISCALGYFLSWGPSWSWPHSNSQELLVRLSKHNFKVNPHKVKFKTNTATFTGHVFTSEGLKPSAATRRFLGTYLSKFCPHLSEVVLPLHGLTHIKQYFVWADQHTEAFTKAKEFI